MTRITFAFIAGLFFVLGFMVNEFRHNNLLDQPDQNPQSTPHNLHSASGDIQANVPTQTTLQPETPTANNHEQSAQRKAEAFSWVHVEQLMNQGDVTKAISLLKNHKNRDGESAQLWFYLAKAYEQHGDHKPSLEAWFRYLDYETNMERVHQAIAYMKNYLMRLKQSPSLYGQDTYWLIEQFNKLLELTLNDGELHLMLAALYIDIQDNYQAQYHALMAANDPSAQARAEDILAQLNGTKVPDNLAIPLRPFGNQYLVDVMVEGHKARLLLDTGASLSGLSTSFTDKHPSLVKATKPIRLSTAGGDVDSFLFTVTRLEIENLQFDQHILALLPMGNANQFDGLLGVDILGRFDFVIDREASVLRLRAQKR